MAHVAVVPYCYVFHLTIFSYNSEVTKFLSYMRGMIPEGPRPNSGKEPHFLTQPRYLFLLFYYIVYPSGIHVAHHTKLFGTAVQKVAMNMPIHTG